MRSSLLVASLALAASLGAQNAKVPVLGETQTPPGSFIPMPPPVSSPNYTPGIVPASLRNAFGNSNNNIPFSWTPCSYQQIFLGSELPAASYPVLGLGLRQDNQFSGYAGFYVDMEMKLGFSTLTEATLTSTFASNYSAPPTVVVARRIVAQPNMPSTLPTDPTVLFHHIKFDRPWIWTQVAGRNVIVEVRNHANGNNNATFTYPLDAGSGAGTTTTRLYGLVGPNDLTGTLGVNYGLVMCFLDRAKTTATYSFFNTGCKGTGGFAGQVVPAAYQSTMGNSNNYFPHGAPNMRYQQVFLGSELTRPGLFNAWALRQTATTTGRPGGTSQLLIKLGHTTFDNHSVSISFDSNFNVSPPTTVFNGVANIPTLTGTNTNPGNFAMIVPFSSPWLWAPVPGRNLCIEVVNTSTVAVTQYLDAAAGATCTTTRMWATTATNAWATGIGIDNGLVMGFRMPGDGSAVPAIGAVGRPRIGQSMDVTLALAKPTVPALLTFGVSNTLWGAIPLPFDLTTAGAPGCKLLTSAEILFGVVTDAAGQAKVTFNIPNVPGLVDTKWYNQFWVFDTNANTLGMAFSAGGEALVGEL